MGAEGEPGSAASALSARSAANRKAKRVYSTEDVKAHSDSDDCWMIINGRVYDVTSYINLHPGGHRALLNYAGRDGSANVEFHSKKMMHLLNTYFYIGEIEGARRCTVS